MYSPRSKTPWHPSRQPSRHAAGRFGAALCLLAVVGAAAACSSDSKSASTTEPATTTATTTIKATTTTEEATTTSEATTSTTTTTTVAATTTTVPAKPVYPLTGVENPDPVVAARPALIVKIDNASGARPRAGSTKPT